MRLQRNNRGSLSLRILLASLIAVALVLTLTFKFQLSAATDHVRAQGVNLARLATKLPVSAQQRSGFEQVLMYQLSSRDFAYGTVVSANGTTLVEVTASGVIVPGGGALAGNAWVQEVPRRVQDAAVIEWYGPLRVGDEMGHFRIGFFKPTLALALISEQLPFIASLMLPVFLLAPLFLLLVKREVNPLTKVNAAGWKRLRKSWKSARKN